MQIARISLSFFGLNGLYSFVTVKFTEHIFIESIV